MMFGLPAAAFAIYKNARPERKKVVGGFGHHELIHLRDLYNFRIQTRTVNRKYDVNQMELMSVQ
jgi:hypothetical protein